MKKDLVTILSDLIAIPSPYPPGTSVEICAYAAKRLKKAGYKVEIATHKKGVDNVVARMKAKAKGPVIAFNAHVHTVGAGEGRACLWPRCRQLQGQHGGAALARRGDRAARRPEEGRADLHLRCRRG